MRLSEGESVVCAAGSISVVHVGTCGQLQEILDSEKIEACIIYSAKVVGNGNGKRIRNTARKMVPRYATGSSGFSSSRLRCCGGNKPQCTRFHVHENG